ncbi:MAG: glucosamine-6-phosphate deaminase [Actinobacteria bacterium]|nr:glucosamine-6-phosphate deaminase [Actinomycetota bacterium]
MEILVKNDYNQMSIAAAEIIAGLIRKKPDCVLGFATGGTPIGTYRELIRMHKENGLDFSNVKTFNLDEYLGIGINLEKPYELDQSYARFMYEELFKHINIKKENINLPDGLAKEPDNFCQWYEIEIKKAGGIDIQLLGIGADGHWAFNEPGSSLASRTRVQALTKQTLDDNYESFYKKANIKRQNMPHYAITMGIGTILESRHALMIASGAQKAAIVSEALEGCITSKVTASALQLHPGKVTVILDSAAASKLTWSIKY